MKYPPLTIVVREISTIFTMELNSATLINQLSYLVHHEITPIGKLVREISSIFTMVN